MSQSKLEFDEKAACLAGVEKAESIIKKHKPEEFNRFDFKWGFERGAKWQFERDKLAHAQLLAAAEALAKAFELIRQTPPITSAEIRMQDCAFKAIEKFEAFKKAGGK